MVPTWDAWKSFLCALFGLPMSDGQLETYRQCTGRSKAPGEAFSEAWLVCGRRDGKSSVLALVAVFLACFKDYKPYLRPRRGRHHPGRGCRPGAGAYDL
jgi:hypothetical protein